MSRSRGFVTIATGKNQYHKMAKTLVKSYKLTTHSDIPFCVITDDKEDPFAEFDDVVRIDNATRSYMDKIELIQNSPYDETIFIDSDCIVFNDLSFLWEDFLDGVTFSAYGRTSDIDSGEKVWFQKSDAGKYSDRIRYIIDLHGGIYFFRKNAKLYDIYETCKDIIENYNSLRFKDFTKPADEPIFALAMVLHGEIPLKNNNSRYCFLKNTKIQKADFFTNELSYIFNKETIKDEGRLIHFGTSRTILPIYQIERRKVDYMWNYRKKCSFPRLIFMYLSAYLNAFFLCAISARKQLLKKYKI